MQVLRPILKKNKKNKKKPERQNPRANGKSKPIQTKLHKEARHTQLEKEKNEKIFFLKKRKRASKSINKSTSDNKL